MAERLKWRVMSEEEVGHWRNRCNAARCKRKRDAKVFCELPGSHSEKYHFGRDRRGRWHSWPVVQTPSEPTVSG